MDKDIRIESEEETTVSGCPMCACHKTKDRDEKEKKDMINRLRRIEGQVRGVQKMVEEDAYCLDVITQVAAINAALNSFNRVLLTEHLHTCVADGVRSGDDSVLDELTDMLKKLMK